MLGSISIQQFNEWRTYANLEPFDETRADYRTASIVSALYHAFRGKGKPKRPIADFVMYFGEKPQKTWQQMKALGKLLAEGFNREDPKKRNPRG